MDSVYTVDALKELLETLSGYKLRLRINQNVSTMLSVRREGVEARLSIHKMFLSAPMDVVNALVMYIKGRYSDVKSTIQCYIDSHFSQLDYTDRVKRGALVTKGVHFDLEQVYNDLNARYFGGQLNLSITWYGKLLRKRRRAANLGLYYDPYRLVKVHRLLDRPGIPHEVLAFVVYHEMVHHVCPPYVDENGRHRIHTPEFKAKEREYSHFEQASQWIRTHVDQLFDGYIN